MGYSIYQLQTKLLIPNEEKSNAYLSLKKLIDNFYDSESELAFINKWELESDDNLEELLSIMRWIPNNNQDGDIVDLEFSGEKLGDDFQIFNSIAEYVEEGSFITFIGEDSKVWRWLFANGKIIEQKGVLVFEN